MTPERLQAIKESLYHHIGDKHRQYAHIYKQYVSELLKEVETLRKLVASLADPEPCRYDHHDLCQSHWLHPKPCPHSEATTMLRALSKDDE